MKPAILIYFAICIYSCATPSNKTPLIAKDSTNEIERNNKLFAFVGEKMDVKAEPGGKEYSLNNEFTAWYKVVQSVYGKYDSNRIQFTVYDHGGWPEFAKYKNALLFVSEDSGRYIHEKYMYYDVYKTKSGRWAGSYAIHDYTYHNITTVKPEIIDFKTEVSYPVKTEYQDGSIEEHYYPEPYFKIVGDKAIAIYGNYIEDLFRIKKEGSLSDLFVQKSTDRSIKVESVSLELPRIIPIAEEKKFMAFWENTFVPIIKSGNLQMFKNWSLASIFFCGSARPIETFDQKCFQRIFKNAYVSDLIAPDGMSFSSYETTDDLTTQTTGARHTIVKKKDHIIYEMSLKEKPNYRRAISFKLKFVETDNGYALIDINSEVNTNCCQ